MNLTKENARVSQRELEVLQLIAHECTTKEIAQKLYISYETASTHRRNLLSKLNVRNTASLVYQCCKMGILTSLALLFSMSGLLSQSMDVEGDAKIRGRLDIGLDLEKSLLIGIDVAPLASLGSSTESTFIGYNAAYDLTTAKRNTFIGTFAGRSTTSGGDNVFIGTRAGLSNTTGRSNLYMGTNAGRNATTSTSNIYIGGSAGRSNISGSWNIAIGQNAGEDNTSGHHNISIGAYAAESTGATVAQNISIGYYAGRKTLTNQSVFIGYFSGSKNTSGAENVFVGGFAGSSNTSGSNNTYMGYEAARYDSIGSNNTYLGHKAGRVSQSTGNTLIGSNAGEAIVSGDSNLVIGYNAGTELVDGRHNVLLGVNAEAGQRITIGAATFNNPIDGSNQIVIGAEATGAGGNTAVIGNSSLSKLYVGELGMGTIVATSDRRFKKEINNSSMGLDFINRLRPVSFYWKSLDELSSEWKGTVSEMEKNSAKPNYQKQHGFIAQEVKEAVDELGYDWQGWTERESGQQGLDFNAFVAPLVKSIQELDKKYQALLEQNTALSAQVSALQAEISNQSKSISEE